MSHIVYAARDAGDEAHRLSVYGYEERSGHALVPNPPAKAPFICGPLVDATAMRLLVPSVAAPALEMICEPRDGVSAEPFFEAVLTEAPLSGPEVVRSALQEEPVAGLPGMRCPASVSQARCVGALVLHCRSESETLELWRLLGVAHEPAGGDLSRLAVRGIRSSQRLYVYLLADRSDPGTGYLNDTGVVCLSFFCKDADSLRKKLIARDYEVGDCFDIAPFGTRLRIFFMRNTSGEIYEFLSVPMRSVARTG